jgi:Coenzyme PQQ synthesis protein D (PqqD)
MTVTLHRYISTTDTDDGMVLLDERIGRYFQLNASGSLVLGALINGAEVPQVARLLTQHYTISHERAVADITALIDHLHTAGVIP